MRDDDITRSLGRLLGAQTLTGRVATQAEAIHNALTRPKRVTIMGPPKSGKSDLMALLAGNRVVGADVSLGTIRLVYGEQARTRMTLPDGSTQEMSGVPTAATLDGGVVPIETTIEAPLPALKKVSLMRLAEANSLEDQVKAMHWAAGKSDIVIWCTHRFATVEKKMWLQMPERVRDQAFVLRTSLVGFDHNVDTARSDLGRRVGDEFAFVFAADLKVALSAQISSPIDTEGMKKSGATTIISTLVKEIDQGRENVTHQAELLLAKYPAPEETAEEAAQIARQEAEPAPVDPTPDLQDFAEPEAEAAPAPDEPQDVILDAISDLAGDKPVQPSKVERPTPAARRKDRSIFPTFETDSTDAEAEDATPDAAPEAKPAAAAVERPELAEETVVLCKDMIVRLSKLGAPYAESDGHRGMFDAGLKTLSWIDEALADVANDDVPHVARLQQMTDEATDYIHLLRLEDNDTAALDAVTILLQMKRSVHSLLAA